MLPASAGIVRAQSYPEPKKLSFRTKLPPATFAPMEEKRIHQSQLRELLERRQGGRPREFSIEYCKRSTGELVRYPRAVLSSWHSRGSTINVLPVGQPTPRKIRRCLITRIDGMKIYF